MEKWIAVASLLAFLCGPAIGAPLTGKVEEVKDGDDLRVGGVRIRLCGIDAADRGTRRKRAKQALAGLVEGKTVRCVRVDEGTPCDGLSKQGNRGRIVAQCFVAAGSGTELDVAGELVKAKELFCDWERFSGGYYRKRFGGSAC